ncbi:hypothetical protein AB0436_22535 [Streptomyces sp. NPDC051322]|uniref:hypothetical protein n=1 Tax=Streptomyces sp. NPDC051322 TaxID=3154645 RepID=UPI00344CBE56
MMIRNVLGSVVALVGAAAAVFSPFRIWYDGRHGSAYRIQDLFTGITNARPDTAASILIPFAVAAAITVIGVLLRSRLLVLLAGVITIAFTVLWMVQVGRVQHGLTLSGNGTGLDVGVAIAWAGGILLLIGAALMSGRKRRPRRVGREYAAPASSGPDNTGRISSSDLPEDLTAPPERGPGRPGEPGQWGPRE